MGSLTKGASAPTALCNFRLEESFRGLIFTSRPCRRSEPKLPKEKHLGTSHVCSPDGPPDGCARKSFTIRLFGLLSVPECMR